MEHNIRILKSYSKVWKIERVFYQIGGLNLKNPVALNTMIYYIVFALLMYLTRKVPLISLIPGMYKYLIIPAVLAWLCNNKLLDGKNPISFILSIAKHYMMIFTYGYCINRYKFIKKSEITQYTNKISYRTIEKI